MGRPPDEDMRELLVRSQFALRMLQNEFAEFLGVSDRTMRRWTVGGTRLTHATLVTLASAVHANDPALAARIAAAQGQTLEDLGIGLSPVAAAVIRAATDVVGVSPGVMRRALAAAMAQARASGLTMEALCSLLAAPSPATKKR